jgi:NTP pyrophosphatase (non-canonical NTP hydrolase)
VRKGDKENFSEELADVCIRVFDCAATLGIDLESEILKKMAKNEKREHKHGGKLA